MSAGGKPHDPSRGEKPYVTGCYGTNPRTGQRVGERHKWSEGAGKGPCVFCGKYREDVMSSPVEPEKTLDQVIAASLISETDYVPVHWDGRYGVAAGWYARQNNCAGQWLMGTQGQAQRYPSEDAAREACRQKNCAQSA